MKFRLLLTLLSCVATVTADAGVPPLTHGHYRVLPAETKKTPPFNAVDFAYGSVENTKDGERQWWQLEVRTEDDANSVPLFQLRAVTNRDPLADAAEPLEFLRYQLRIPKADEVLEYVNVHTGKPLLPAWGDFVERFVPRPARATRRQKGMPNTCDYLGHVLTLRNAGEKAVWATWPEAKVLKLDPELTIGTGRDFKDKEGHRLPQKPERTNYTYIPFTPDDYRTMIEAGFNHFHSRPDSESLLRTEPVFYMRGMGYNPPVSYPADFYRSNYIGAVMFLDEPTCIMTSDKLITTTLRYFTDAADLITRRVRSQYMLTDHGHAYHLETALKSRGISFGDMRLAEVDFPTWETVYATAWYQLAGGCTGIVHEGRYQLEEFNSFAKASTGFDRKYTPEEMYKYIYAHLRGAARHFNKDWGTSIYGQADPAITPLAMSMAYDMGARYLWYWTSDHDHHMPWPEQIELTRGIRKHMADKPRLSIRNPRPTLDKLIVIPYGYFLILESPTGRREPFDLWWVREMDAEGKNEASQRYRQLMQNAFVEINKALDAGETFDISIDDGRQVEGYRKVVRVNDE